HSRTPPRISYPPLFRSSLASRMNPEPMRGILGEFSSAMREEASRHGGTVEKFVGDAIMAVFGLPQAHEDDPQRAVRAAVAMQRRSEEHTSELKSRGHIG